MDVGNVLSYAVVIVVVGFLLGSIPWGLIISKLFYKTDIREHGSGNIGTTNTIRALGKGAGAVVFILDFLKGLVAGVLGLSLGAMAAGYYIYNAGAQAIDPLVITSTSYHINGLMIGLAFLACVAGHIFSPWLKFKGGKGIATAVGCAFVVFGGLGAVIAFAVFVLFVLLTRYVSIGSMVAAFSCPFVAWWSSHGEPVFVIVVAMTTALMIWAHRGNIKRLRDGTESRIGKPKK
ncbi:MAG: glycerol-3-phosphate 1-O-acyltransferase PlsY [Coriobacteriales bacterium]|jgi:glycerol-3-phosphate acyltransferase PlsY|nr:glycerol-3-phosphate 1-O-acyltransferase PlsY [Coriobacteriales bacterium]